MNQTSSTPVQRLDIDDLPQRKISRLEQAIGPEFYRIVRGVVKNPLSVIGTTLIFLFILVALFSEAIIPPVNKRD